MSAAIKDFWLSGWGRPTPPPSVPEEVDLPLPRVDRAFWSGLRIVGTLKHKVSSSVAMRGEALHNTNIHARLKAEVLHESRLKTNTRGTCLKRSSDKLLLNGATLKHQSSDQLPLIGSCLNRTRKYAGLSGVALHTTSLKAQMRARNSTLIAMAALLDESAFAARTMQKWVYNAQGDDKTCPDCSSLDGQTIEVEDISDLLMAFPYGEAEGTDLFHPNTHPNCRCQIVLLEIYYESD